MTTHPILSKIGVLDCFEDRILKKTNDSRDLRNIRIEYQLIRKTERPNCKQENVINIVHNNVQYLKKQN